ncbi:MAG: LysM peptidoglycan-binding domain-containing protein, partial [Anaerolineaceae bacterium]|nr:LysM peptidoglycan-binding domain-containing protein [Anaerolineaceae bacterium]
SLSVAENMVGVFPETSAPFPTKAVKTATPAALLSEKTLVVDAKTATPGATRTAIKIVSPTTPAAETCQPPEGWSSYTIQAGDTLDALAKSYQTTKTALKDANCLVSDTLLPNTIIYLPPALPTATLTPQPTATAIQCSAPPYGWTTYTVKAGDTLTSLSYRYQISVKDLQKYNCLGNSYAITVGQQLFVPYRPTLVPTNPPAWTPYPTVTQPPLPTVTPYPTTTVDSNTAPLDLTLSNDGIAENQVPGTIIGSFSTADADPGDYHTLTLLNADGGSFTISGNNLVASAPLNYEAKSLYTIRVRTTDRGGLSLDKTFWISITNVNEAPTNMTISGTSVTSGQPAGTVVGVLMTMDVDNGDSHSYSLFGGETGSFSLQGNVLVTNTVLDAELKSSYNIIIRSTDQGGLWVDKQFIISVLPAP